MVTILVEKCNGCGTCAEICQESCMTVVDGKIQIDAALCSTCTQCIAICPRQTLQWENIAPAHFVMENLPTAAQMDEFLKQRRTIRYFTEEKPDALLVQQIVDYAAYAPSHSHDFRIIAVDKTEQLQAIDTAVLDFNSKMYRFVFNNMLMKLLIKLASKNHQQEFAKARPKIEGSLKQGRGYRVMPPMILFIIGTKNTPLSLESAQYLLYNIEMYARTCSLGCRNLVGNQMIFNSSKIVRNMLKLRKHEKIYAVCGLGYPSKKFRNKIQGRKMSFSWN